MQYYCPVNKKIYIPKQKYIVYLLTTKSQHLYNFPDLGNLFLGCRAKHQPGPLTDIRDTPGPDGQLQNEAWHSFSHCCSKTSVSKPPFPTSQSICWMKTSLNIQIPLELRWVQIQGWLSCLAGLHDVVPQLPHSIPGPHLRLQLHRASPAAWGVPERPHWAALPSALVSPFSSSSSSCYGCLPSHISGMIQLRESTKWSFLGERHEQQVSSENSSNLLSQPKMVITWTRHVIKATNQSHWIHLFSPHSLALSGGGSFESSWNHGIGSPNYTWVSAVKSDSRYVFFKLKIRKLLSDPFPVLCAYFLLQRFVWNHW